MKISAKYVGLGVGP